MNHNDAARKIARLANIGCSSFIEAVAFKLEELYGNSDLQARYMQAVIKMSEGLEETKQVTTVNQLVTVMENIALKMKLLSLGNRKPVDEKDELIKELKEIIDGFTKYLTDAGKEAPHEPQ